MNELEKARARGAKIYEVETKSVSWWEVWRWKEKESGNDELNRVLDSIIKESGPTYTFRPPVKSKICDLLKRRGWVGIIFMKPYGFQNKIISIY